MKKDNLQVSKEALELLIGETSVLITPTLEPTISTMKQRSLFLIGTNIVEVNLYSSLGKKHLTECPHALPNYPHHLHFSVLTVCQSCRHVIFVGFYSKAEYQAILNEDENYPIIDGTCDICEEHI